MNIPLISGQIAKLHVKLETEDDFELYGGTTKAGFSITPERPETKNEWLVTIDEPEVAGKPLTRFDIYVRQMSSGREWVVLSGKILVSPRSAGVDADKLAPIEYNVTIPVVENAVDLTGAAIVTGIPGPRGWSAYEIAVQNGFVGSEPEWLENMRQQTATLAVEQVTPLMERAEAAAKGAEAAKAEAEMQAENAETYMLTASNKAAEAKAHMQAAAAEVTKAAAEVQKAAAEVEKATQERETAAGHAAAAAQSAQDALANQQGAEQAAQDAAHAQQGAETAKTQADAAKVEAQTAEATAKGYADTATAAKTAAEQARTQAQAAQTKAEQEAAKAEGFAGQLGDAALKGADNTFTGTNTFNGSITGSGDIGGVSLDSMIGADYRKYEWVETLEQLYAVCPDAKNMTSWYYQCPKLWITPFRNNTKLINLFWYSEAETNHDLVARMSTQAMSWSAQIVLPNATSLGNGGLIGRGYPYKHDSSVEVYAPKATNGKITNYATPRRLKMISSFGSLSVFNFQSSMGAENLEVLDAPLNVIKTLNLQEFSGLRQVLSAFPEATSINVNSAQLDKASTLLIVNNLQPYNAETMTKTPTLTIGIHIDHQSNEEVAAALATASAAVEDGGKGWEVAVAWNGTATASTFALRPAPTPPVYAKVDTYTDDEGTEQLKLKWCHQVSTPDGKEPEELEYTLFESVEEARVYFNLPEPEEALTEE